MRQRRRGAPGDDDVSHEPEKGVGGDCEQQQPEVPPEDDGNVHKAHCVDDVEAMLADAADREVRARMDDFALLIVARARSDVNQPAGRRKERSCCR